MSNWILFPGSFQAGVRYRQHVQGQRYGQAIFNTASYFWPEHVNSLAGSSYDPFHNDDKVEQFLTIVLERLTNPKA